MKLEIDGAKGKEVKSYLTLAAFKTDDDPESTQSLIAGSYDDLGDIMTLLECAAVTAIQPVLNLEEMEDVLISTPKALIGIIDTYNNIFNKLKANVFSELFDKIVKNAIDNNKNDASFALELAKILPKVSNNFKVQAFKIGKEEINKLKKQAVEALGLDSENDIQIDIQELLKQLGKDLDDNV